MSPYGRHRQQELADLGSSADQVLLYNVPVFLLLATTAAVTAYISSQHVSVNEQVAQLHAARWG